MALTQLHHFPSVHALIRPQSDARTRGWDDAMRAKGYTVVSRAEKLGRRAYVIGSSDGRLQLVQWPETAADLIIQEPERGQLEIARALFASGLLDEAPIRRR